VAFSPDGKQVVSGSRDNIIQLWDAVTGALLQILEGHTSSVTSVAFSFDNKQVVSRSWGNTVLLWDVATGALLQTLEGHTSSVTSVAFSSNSKQVVSSSWGNTVLLLKVATGALLQTLEGHTSLVTSVAFSPHGKLLPTLLVSDKWVVENRANILWLPSEYRTTVIAVWNRSLALAFHRGSKGSILFYSIVRRMVSKVMEVPRFWRLVAWTSAKISMSPHISSASCLLAA